MATGLSELRWKLFSVGLDCRWFSVLRPWAAPGTMYLELNERNPQGKSMASILVIDDDPAVLATIKILLERAVHRVEAVDSSRAGLKLLGTRSFDLLIVDIFMPGMDGFETMKLVHQSYPEMPVIVISGHQFPLPSEPPPDFLHMATRLGAVSSLQKPFRPAELLAVVNGSLSISHAAPNLHRKATGIPS